MIFRFSFEQVRQFNGDKKLASLPDVVYVYNPSTALIQSYVGCGKYDGFQPEAVLHEIDRVRDLQFVPTRQSTVDFDAMIFDRFAWLRVFRVSLEERFKALQDLKSAIEWWKRQSERDKSRDNAIEELLKLVQTEEEDLKGLLRTLPSTRSLESAELIPDVLLQLRQEVEAILALEKLEADEHELTPTEQKLVQTAKSIRQRMNDVKKLNELNERRPRISRKSNARISEKHFKVMEDLRKFRSISSNSTSRLAKLTSFSDKHK